MALLTLKVEAERPFLPAKRERDPPVEGPRCGLEGLPEIPRIVPLLGCQAVALGGVQLLELLLELLDRWHELGRQLRPPAPPAIRIWVR